MQYNIMRRRYFSQALDWLIEGTTLYFFIRVVDDSIIYMLTQAPDALFTSELLINTMKANQNLARRQQFAWRHRPS